MSPNSGRLLKLLLKNADTVLFRETRIAFQWYLISNFKLLFW